MIVGNKSDLVSLTKNGVNLVERTILEQSLGTEFSKRAFLVRKYSKIKENGNLG